MEKKKKQQLSLYKQSNQALRPTVTSLLLKHLA